MSPEEFDEVSRMVGPAEIDTVVCIMDQPSRRAGPQPAFSLFSPLQTYLRHLSKHFRACLFRSTGKAGDPELGWDCQQLFFPCVCREKGEEQESKASSVCLAGGGKMGREEGVSL